MKHRTRWYLSAGTVVLAILLWIMLRPSALIVDTAAAAPRRLTVTIDEDGETRVRFRHIVSAPVTGRFEPAGLDEGARVRAGQDLGRFYPVPLDARERALALARLAAAESARQAADARAGRAEIAAAELRRTLERLRRLAAQAPVAPEEMERATSASDAAGQELEAARFDAAAALSAVAAARATLESDTRDTPVVLRAPVSGTVLRVHEECGRVLAAGTPLAEVGDLGRLEIVIDVLSEDAAHVRPGSPVVLVSGDDTVTATVRLVEPSGFLRVSPLGVEEQRVNVIADFAGLPAGLGDRFHLDARIVVWDSSGVLSVPAAALFRSGERWSVFVVQDGRARAADVTIGRLGGGLAQIRGGLAAGDRVILLPSDEVRDGRRVTSH